MSIAFKPVIKSSRYKPLKPVIVAGGAGGRGEMAENKSLANGRLDKYGGPSTSHSEINTNEGCTPGILSDYFSKDVQDYQ